MKRNQKSIDSVSRLLYRAPYCDIIMMARFSGNCSKESLETALFKARAKYPLLNSRILQDDDGNTEFMHDYIQSFPITVFYNKAETDWLDLAWDEQKTPFNLQNGQRAGEVSVIVYVHLSNPSESVGVRLSREPSGFYYS